MKLISSPRTRVTDMTSGEPLKLILLFAIPLFIGNFFQQIYTVVDTAVVGHVLGDKAISAVGATSALYSLMITLSSGLNGGYAIVTTQAFGARDTEKLRRSIAAMLVLNLLASVLITALAIVFIDPLLSFLNTPETVFNTSRDYLTMLILGMVTTTAYNLFAGVLRAVGNSRTPLYHLIVACIANVILDIVLVAVFSLGVVGAALATVIAQAIAAVCSGCSFFKNYKEFVPSRTDFKVTVEMYREMLYSGISMALMMSIVNVGSIIFGRATNKLGNDIIAAHSAAHKIFTVFIQPLSTVAAATSTFVSQNKGAGLLDRIRKTLTKVMLFQIAWGVFSLIICVLFGEWMIRLLTGTDNDVIISNALLSIRICTPFFSVLGVLQCLRTSMQAMGSRIAPVLSSFVELAVKAVGANALIPKLGYLGACVTEPATWVIMTLFLVISYSFIRKRLFIK